MLPSGKEPVVICLLLIPIVPAFFWTRAMLNAIPILVIANILHIQQASTIPSLQPVYTRMQIQIN